MSSKKPWKDYDEEFEKEILEFCKIHNIKKIAKEYLFEIGDKRYIYSYNKAELSNMYTGSLPWVKPERTNVIHIRGNQKGLMETYMNLLLSSLIPKPLSGIEKAVKGKYPREEYIEEKPIIYNPSMSIQDKLSSIKNDYIPEQVEAIIPEEEKAVNISDKLSSLLQKKKDPEPDIETEEVKVETVKKTKTLPKPEPIKIKTKVNPKPSVDKKKQAMDMLLKRR